MGWRILGVEAPGWRGARRARTRRYATDEQRSQPGWIGVQKRQVILRQVLIARAAISAFAALPALAVEPLVGLAPEGALSDTVADLVAEQESAASFYGYTDFAYQHPIMSRSNPWRSLLADDATFYVGNLNLYMANQWAERWKSLAEVRFLYLPHGATDEQSGAGIDTGLRDYADYQSELHWGGIEIERAQLDFQAHEYVTARVGQWLTPYGIWNIDHGSPTIIGVQRPYSIAGSLFPERQTGLQLLGAVPLGRHQLGYNLTLSNGRGAVDTYQDLDENKAVGGRLEFASETRVHARLGASVYAGRFTKTQDVYGTDANGYLSIDENTVEQYDELALGTDLLVEARGLRLQAELVVNDRAYTEGGRPQRLTAPGEFVPDFRAWGGYGLLGYRFTTLGLMPFGIVEWFRSEAFGEIVGIDRALGYGLGINARPHPRVTLKLQVMRGTFGGATDSPYADADLTLLQTQVAWAF